MFKIIVLVLNSAITTIFFLQHQSYLVLLSPALHILLFFTPAACYANHCHPKKSYEQCQECGLQKWIRMRHCYRCKVCVHKFDHHCILLDICIGECNQKYFILFLWFHLLNSLIQIQGNFFVLKKSLWMDQKGKEHLQFSYYITSLIIIFFILNVFVVGYLCIYHCWLISNNETTYQRKRRQRIYYLKNIKDTNHHPFSQGIIKNWFTIFTSRASSPTQWQRPS